MLLHMELGAFHLNKGNFELTGEGRGTLIEVFCTVSYRLRTLGMFTLKSQVYLRLRVVWRATLEYFPVENT